MRYTKYEEMRSRTVLRDHSYSFLYYLLWDYSFLDKCLSRKKNGKKSDSYSEVYMMFDTETSKHHRPKKIEFGRWEKQSNHVCAWTLSIRAFNTNIVTLRGTKPSELTHCMELIRAHLKGDKFFIFAHNLSYDWTYCRRFIMDKFGEPSYQLNVKNHYPVLIEFGNGMVLRDSLILAAVSLQRWADNMDVEHKKAVGSWDYDLIRDQNHIFTNEELHYIENDTLAGVECLNKLARMLNDAVCTLPLTNTGIVRRIVRKLGKQNYAKQHYNKMAVTWEEYQILEMVFHGGYTHANRYMVGYIWLNVICYDFKSSYPYCMLAEKYPMEKFAHLDGKFTIKEILRSSEDTAFIFRFSAVGVRLKDPHYPMPCLQWYKCTDSINHINDNGYILSADYLSIWLTEIDLKRVAELYDFTEYHITDVMAAAKDYLPKWYRDEVWHIFCEKCDLEYQIKELHEGDPVLYALKKANLNSLYGMMVQKKVTEDIKEAYEDGISMESGDYYIDHIDMEEAYYKNEKSYNNILPYVHGVYVTAYAKEHLYQLAECINDIHDWLYSDTDSIYSNNWNDEKLKAYNDSVKKKLEAAGYGAYTVGEKSYHLGAAEFDGEYTEYITQGSKRYAGIKKGELVITVAGVPKKNGPKCMKNGLDDFHEGFRFQGEITGKKELTYIYHEMDVDDRGNEYADSVDMNPSDYTLSCVEKEFIIDQEFMEEVLLSIIEMDF